MVGIAESVVRLSSPAGYFVDRSSKRSIDKLCEVWTDYLKEEAGRLLLEAARSRPITKVYMSDGTPLLMNRAWSRMLGHKVVNRHAKKCSEYLLERTYYKAYDHHGQRICAVTFRSPVCLESKAAWH